MSEMLGFPAKPGSAQPAALRPNRHGFRIRKRVAANSYAHRPMPGLGPRPNGVI